MSAAPFTILVVDDQPDSLVLMSAGLESAGHEVLRAQHGREGLEMLGQESVDLVVLDVVMPGLGGFEVLQQLRHTHPPERVPVIMATARDAPEDVVQAFELGANDYVTKPIDPRILAARVQAQLRGKRARRVEPKEQPDELVEPGAILGEKYRLEGLIGHGSFGDVYDAVHEEILLPVAVKVLREERRKGDADTAAFRREAVHASRLRHRNAVSIHDFGVTSGGLPYLVMERLDGHSLEEELQRHGRLPPERVAEILRPVADVLDAAKGLGIVHRDIKPSNIFFDHRHGEQVVKVVDFGIAQDLQQPDEDEEDGASAIGAGTLAYMAPERLANRPYDGAADVYSLGVLLYEVLTGQPPFTERNLFKLIRCHLHETPLPPRALCPELAEGAEEVVLAALAKDPAERPTALELSRSFNTALG